MNHLVEFICRANSSDRANFSKGTNSCNGAKSISGADSSSGTGSRNWSKSSSYNSGSLDSNSIFNSNSSKKWNQYSPITQVGGVGCLEYNLHTPYVHSGPYANEYLCAYPYNGPLPLRSPSSGKRGKATSSFSQRFSHAYQRFLFHCP